MQSLETQYDPGVALETLDKSLLLNALVARLAEEAEGMARRARDIAASATHDEARPENDKDTRAIEESYLARGQAERVAQAQTTVQLLRTLRCQDFSQDRPIAATATVLIEDEEGNEKILFLAPAAGGTKVETQGRIVQVITPASPLGRKLLGQTVDDEFELHTKGAKRCWTIVEVI